MTLISGSISKSWDLRLRSSLGLAKPWTAYILFLIHLLHHGPGIIPPVQQMHVMRVHYAAAVEADQLSPLDVPCDKQPLPLVSAGVHVPHVCATNLNYSCFCLYYISLSNLPRLCSSQRDLSELEEAHSYYSLEASISALEKCSFLLSLLLVLDQLCLKLLLSCSSVLFAKCNFSKSPEKMKHKLSVWQ